MKSGRHIASIWEALGSVVAPLGAVGCLFSDSDCNTSAQKYPKDDLGGLMKIDYSCVFFSRFMRLAGASGGPNNGLETLLEHLRAHWGTLGTCAAYLHHDGPK